MVGEARLLRYRWFVMRVEAWLLTAPGLLSGKVEVAALDREEGEACFLYFV